MRFYVNVLGLDNQQRVLPVDAPETITPAALAATIQQQQRGRVTELLNPTDADRAQFDTVPPLNLLEAPLPSTGEQTAGSAPTPPEPQGIPQPGRTMMSEVPPTLAGLAAPVGLTALGVTNPLALAGAGIMAAGGPGALAGHFYQKYMQPESPNVPLTERMALEARDQALGEAGAYAAGKVLPQGLRSIGEGLQTRGRALEASHTLPAAPKVPVMTPPARQVAAPTLFDATGKKITSATEQAGVKSLNKAAMSNAKKKAAYETERGAYQRTLDQRRLEGPGPSITWPLSLRLSDAARPMQSFGRALSAAPESPAAQLGGRALLQGGLRARYTEAPDLTNPDGTPAF